MTAPPQPVLQSLVRAAVEGTGASRGWLLAVRGDHLEVVAAYGHDAGSLLGATMPLESGSAGFVVASGQPLAMTPRGDDPRFAADLFAQLGSQPSSVLCVPCDDDDDATVGALELVDKVGNGPFSFDDVEIVTMLAAIAGVAIAQSEWNGPRPPSPDELAGELHRLAVADPTHYATVASVINALLIRG
jgi:GAF domain-containing protein